VVCPTCGQSLWKEIWQGTSRVQVMLRTNGADLHAEAISSAVPDERGMTPSGFECCHSMFDTKDERLLPVREPFYLRRGVRVS
jgi:hypothetical protein